MLSSMRTTAATHTRADYQALPEGAPVELVEGELVREPAPAYRHHRVVGRLLQQLFGLVGVEHTLHAPVDVVLDDLNVYQPDVAVVAEPLAPDAESVGVPVWVCEVLSPATAHVDRTQKTRNYLRAGVAEVWLVDPVSATLTVVTADGSRTHGADELVSSSAVPGLAATTRSLLG
jgi:Uma2 family endonuclease